MEERGQMAGRGEQLWLDAHCTHCAAAAAVAVVMVHCIQQTVAYSCALLAVHGCCWHCWVRRRVAVWERRSD